MICSRCNQVKTNKNTDINKKTGKLKALCKVCCEKDKIRLKKYYKEKLRHRRKNEKDYTKKIAKKVSDEELDKISERFMRNNGIEQDECYYNNSWSGFAI